MTVSYATALADSAKQPVYILEFPDHSSTRWCSRRQYDNLSSTANYGMSILDDLPTTLDLRTGELEIGQVKVRLQEDNSGTVSTFLNSNDSTLVAADVTLKHGFLDVAEANFQSIAFQLTDWYRDGSGYVLVLTSALTFLDRPLYEDFDGENYNIALDFTLSSSTLSLEANLTEAGWPSTGYVLLTDGQTNEVELVEYSSFTVFSQSRTDLTIGTRRVNGVGAVGKYWSADQGGGALAWVIQDDPFDAFLRMATTTNQTAGTNGTWDAGDGYGLGAFIDVALLDSANIQTARSKHFADASGGVRDALYVGVEKIDSVKEFWEQELLALGFYFGVTTSGTLTIKPLIDLSASSTSVATKIQATDVVRVERGYGKAENNVQWKWDYSPQREQFHKIVSKGYSTSQTRYGKAKLREVESRGARGVSGTAFGWPDKGWDLFMDDKAGDYLTELANPSPPVTLRGLLELQDTGVGDLIAITHPGIYDVINGTMGVTSELFYVVGVERSPQSGDVGLEVVQRRLVSRPWFIAPDSNNTTYSNASDAEKQYGYIPPDAGNFPDGGAPYDTGI